MLRRKRKDAIDLAAEQILEVLKTKPVDEVRASMRQERAEAQRRTNIDRTEKEGGEKNKDIAEKEPETSETVDPGDTPIIESQKLAKFLEPMGDELTELERAMERVRPKIESVSKLAPKLNEMKELLQKDIQKRQGNLAAIAGQISDLEEQRKNLQEYILSRRKEKELLERDIHEKEERVRQISGELPNLIVRKEEIEKALVQEERDEHSVDQHLERISKLSKDLAY